MDLEGTTQDDSTRAYNSTSISKVEEQIWLWYKRLGHPSFGYLQKLFPKLFSALDISKLHCEVCELAKHQPVPYPLSINTSLSPIAIIHSDVWGPSRVISSSGARWFVTFIDDYSRVSWVYLLKDK